MSIKHVSVVLVFLFASAAASQSAVTGDINFDQDENIVQNGSGQDNLQQWPNACGDDPNEYLIREHSASGGDGEMDPALTRDNRYVCADRPSDCAYNGRVFSEGQWADVGSSSSNDERGQEISDPEVCLDLDSSKGGGEWYDMDDIRMREGEGTIPDSKWDKVRKYANKDYWGVNPGTDQNIDTLGEWDSSGWTQTTNYTDIGLTGYAVEDDCEESLQACDDDGNTELDGSSAGPWFNAGNFEHQPSQDEGAEQDNFGSSYSGVHNKMQDSSDQFEPGAATQQNWEAIYGSDYNFTDLQDSTPGPDNWALTDGLDKAIGNDGSVYGTGQCFYRPGVSERTSKGDDSVFKTDKVFGNSFADEDGGQGVWKDPDDLSSSKADFSCDLTGPDRGYGHDTNSGNPNNWNWKDPSEEKVVIGDIAWASDDFSSPTFVQEKSACGDDNKEFLLEEQGEVTNPSENSGRWGCAWERDYCVSRDSTGKNFYANGDYANAQEPGEEEGRLKNDREVCDMRDNPVNDFQGTWYDQDFKEEYCLENTLYRSEGVRWINSTYVENHPQAVNEGIDDDLNQYFKDNGVSTLESNPDINSVDSDETPVTAGEPESEPDPRVVTRGFCAGDDESEYLITQRCRTDLCKTDNSYLGAAEDPDKCLLDQKSTSGVSGDQRDIYDEGDEVNVNSEVMACYNGQWWDEWPVQFLRDSYQAPIGEETRTSFILINPEDTQKTFDLELSFLNTDDGERLDSRVYFQESGTNTMEESLNPSSSKTGNLVIRGGGLEENISMTDVTIKAESGDGGLTGTDTASIGILNISGSSQTQNELNRNEERDVPGITSIQMAWLMIVSSVFYFFMISGRIQ